MAKVGLSVAVADAHRCYRELITWLVWWGKSCSPRTLWPYFAFSKTLEKQRFINITNRWIHECEEVVNCYFILSSIRPIGWNLAGNDSDSAEDKVINDGQPNYQTDDSVTFVYNPTGNLAYKLVSEKIDNYTEGKITFSKPVLTTYNEAGEPTWTVKAFKARLTNDRILYLYSDVQVDSLTKSRRSNELQLRVQLSIWQHKTFHLMIKWPLLDMVSILPVWKWRETFVQKRLN